MLTFGWINAISHNAGGGHCHDQTYDIICHSRYCSICYVLWRHSMVEFISLERENSHNSSSFCNNVLLLMLVWDKYATF